MSLLMDALRKAEEAKRQTAQKQNEDTQAETETPVSEPTTVEDSSAIEDFLEFDQDLDNNFTVPTPPEEASDAIDNVDEAFDFEIDENFSLETDDTEANLDSNTNDPSENRSVDTIEFDSTSSSPEVDSEQPTSEQSEQEIDYLQPNEISRFANLGKSTKPAPQEPDWTDENDSVDNVADYREEQKKKDEQKAASFDNSGLTLEERAPSIEHPSIIADGLYNASDANTAAEQVPATESVAEVEALAVAPEPIRAVRDEEKEKPLVEKTSKQVPFSKTTKLVTPKFTEESRKRESARAVFNAKHKTKDNGSRNKLIATAAVIALFPLLGGGYLLLKTMGVFPSGNQYNIPAGYSANAPFATDPLEAEIVQESALLDLSPEPAIIAVSAPEPEPVIPQLIPEVEDIIAVESVPEPEPELPIASRSPEAADLSVAQTDEAETAIEQNLASNEVADEMLSGAAEQLDAPAPITITRTDNIERVDPQLTQAYASYRSNDFIGARARYQQVLREKPNNRDAMLGLAAVAMRLGDAPTARDSYIKLLELDPRDVHARVGLLETMPASDPVMLESELRSLFASHPEVAQLPFALGNHFASQRRWSEAQESYYDALLAAKANGNGPVSPDYAFNLAVSLERLNQLRPAYTFYREALEQSKLLTPGFDIRILRERLDALERVL